MTRCAVQLSGAADKVANIIFLDGGTFGWPFAWANAASLVKNLPPCIPEMFPESELLWRLNSDYTVSKYTFRALTLASDPTATPSYSPLSIDNSANIRVVECGPDGGVIPSSEGAFAVVPGKDHGGIAMIKDTNHPSFQLIKQFLNGSTFTWSSTGKSHFTFVFKAPAVKGYPRVILPSGTTIAVDQWKAMRAETYNIGGTTSYAWAIEAGANEHGTMKIYWAPDHYVIATLTQGQGTIRKEPIDNA